MQYRKGETKQTRFRAKRTFNVGKEFYFNTREGSIVGPFPNEPAADRGVHLYLQCLSDKSTSGLYANKIALQGLWASTNFK